MAVVKFLTRVELLGSGPADYEILHRSMVAAKFWRVIPDVNGDNFHLPTAEYYSYGEPPLTASQVRDLAMAATKETGRAALIISCAFTDAAWTLIKV